jgi:hypothetical protein
MWRRSEAPKRERESGVSLPSLSAPAPESLGAGLSRLAGPLVAAAAARRTRSQRAPPFQIGGSGGSRGPHVRGARAGAASGGKERALRPTQPHTARIEECRPRARPAARSPWNQPDFRRISPNRCRSRQWRIAIDRRASLGAANTRGRGIALLFFRRPAPAGGRRRRLFATTAHALSLSTPHPLKNTHHTPHQQPPLPRPPRPRSRPSA